VYSNASKLKLLSLSKSTSQINMESYAKKESLRIMIAMPQLLLNWRSFRKYKQEEGVVEKELKKVVKTNPPRSWLKNHTMKREILS